MLNRKLSTVRIEHHDADSPEREDDNDVTFLKEKLYEAQTYIVQLEKENQSLTQ